MRATVVALTLCVLALPLVALAQSDRFFDRIKVTFDQPVKINSNQTIPPGTYVFQQLREKSQPNVFDVRDDSGQHVGLTAMASNAVYVNASPMTVPDQTQVILKKVGNNSYLDRIWIAGQNHGYNFDLAENASPSSTTASANNSSASQSGSAMVPAIREIIVLAVPVGNGTENATNKPLSSTDQGSSTDQQGQRNQASSSPTMSSSTTSGGTSGAATGAYNQSSATGSTSPNSVASPAGDSSTYNSAGSTSSTSNDSAQSTSSTNSGSSASAQSGQQGMQIEGCVTGPYGGSYMLTSTKDGRKYTLTGDYDNIRENLGRVVSVWAIPGSGHESSSNNSQTSPSSASQNEQMGSSTTTSPTTQSQSSINNPQTSTSSASQSGQMGSGSSQANQSQSATTGGGTPVFVTVRTIQRVSETCDSPLR